MGKAARSGARKAGRPQFRDGPLTRGVHTKNTSAAPVAENAPTAQKRGGDAEVAHAACSAPRIVAGRPSVLALPPRRRQPLECQPQQHRLERQLLVRRAQLRQLQQRPQPQLQLGQLELEQQQPQLWFLGSPGLPVRSTAHKPAPWRTPHLIATPCPLFASRDPNS